MVALPAAASAQGTGNRSSSAARAAQAAHAYRVAHEREILTEFVALLALRNVATDTADIRRNAQELVSMMERRGLSPRILEPGPSGGLPAVYGEWKVPGVTRTLIIYAHYDGQPTDSMKWRSGKPWTPALRTGPFDRGGVVRPLPAAGERSDSNWRLYARSASDDKGGVMAILAAIDALRAAKLTPTSNIKLFFEGEEEAGSSGLGDILSRNAQLLAADAWINVDGPVHQSGAKTVVFGVRGDMNVDLTVYGPNHPLHSGHYGNWAPNPAERLARLLASMKDENGRVLVAGWYDDVEPLGDAERQAMAAAPRYDDELRKQLGIARPDGGGKTLAELIAVPSLNINGIASAEVGSGARNVIPTSATAVLDLRLVRGNQVERQFQRLVEHVKRQGYEVLDHTPSDSELLAHPMVATMTLRGGGYVASRTRMDLPIARSIFTAVQATTTRPVVLVPTMGGSLPLSIITERLHMETLIVPIANFDNNQHAEDENIRLGNFWNGIESLAAVMGMQ
jgi:acetylornithine deacetylase/succinyl-diaminopimelate desuccinylase-like protein